MSGNNNETLSNTEIGNFKTPEELAKALESQNQKLADKVRDISKRAIETDSKDLRKRLQDELTPEEQFEIREKLPNSGVGKVLNKGLTNDEKQAEEAKNVIAGVMGKEVAEGGAKLEGYIKSLGDAWDVAGKLFEEGKWMAAIGVILKGLFGQFSLKAWEKKDEEKKGSELVKDTEYQLGIHLLYSLAGKKSKDSNNILGSTQFQSISFNKAKKEYSEKNGIANRLGFNTSNFSDEDVSGGIELLIDSEKTIDKIIGQKYPNWKDLELLKIIDLLNQNGLKTLGGMKEKIEKMDFGFNMIENYEKIFTGLGDYVNIGEINGGEINFGHLSDRKELISGLKKETLSKIIINGGVTKITSESTNEKLINNFDIKDDEEKKFFNKIFDYKNKIIPELSKLFPSDKQSEISTFFSQKGFNLKELIEFYMITGGETDISKLSLTSRVMMYIKFFHVLAKDNSGIAGIFSGELQRRIFDENDITIPKDVKEFLQNMFYKVGKGLWETLKGTTLIIWEHTSPATKVVVGGLLAMFIASRKFRYIIAGVGAATTSFIALKIWNEFQKDPGAKKELEKQGITSAQKLETLLNEAI